MMVTISWIIPLMNAVLVYILHSHGNTAGARNENNFCSYPRHLDTKWWMMTNVVFVLLLICLSALNLKVLLTYFKLKRRHSKLMKENTKVSNIEIKYNKIVEIVVFRMEIHICNIPLMKESTLGNNINKEECYDTAKNDNNLDRLSRMLALIRSYSYVLVILFIFSISYLPGYGLYFYDMFYDQLGYFQSHTIHICGNFNTTLALSYRHDISLGRCMLGLFRDITTSCSLDLPGQIVMSPPTLCATVYYRLHDHMLGNMVPVAMLLVAVNSFANPFIYFIWNAEFVGFAGFAQKYIKQAMYVTKKLTK